jgi:hypothetical protein
MARRLRFRSSDYWDSRYENGGDSGAGSQGRLAAYKAYILNRFVAENGISRVTEFGRGDGTQLKLGVYPGYIGLDVSPYAIKMCMRAFSRDVTKSFFLYSPDCLQDPQGVLRSDLSLSLDVVFHLVEDDVFETYMSHLFSAAERFVIIYSSNHDAVSTGAVHVRHRKFTRWVDNNARQFRLRQHIPNQYPFVEGDETTSFADFYFFERSG